MKNLNEATERICDLKGSLIALDALMPAVMQTLPASARTRLMGAFDAHAEAARTVLLNADISDLVIAAFERDVARNRAILGEGMHAPAADLAADSSVDALVFAVTRITTWRHGRALTNASGFFFRRGERLFVVTNRHVLIDPVQGHMPDRLDVGVHLDATDLTRHAIVSLPLYRDFQPLWREARDSAGLVDLAALEVWPQQLPPGAVCQAFEAGHLQHGPDEPVAMGDALTIVGFPLGFQDTTHHLAVARAATVASAWGIRFQGSGCFLTDARTHRGSSGSPVLRRSAHAARSTPALPWQLLGVHSSRMDMGTRDQQLDESLGLNCAWYADALLAITRD